MLEEEGGPEKLLSQGISRAREVGEGSGTPT